MGDADQGPLMVFDAPMARWLTASSHALDQQRLVRQVDTERRLLDDVFIGYLVASARAGQGLHTSNTKLDHTWNMEHEA